MRVFVAICLSLATLGCGSDVINTVTTTAKPPATASAKPSASSCPVAAHPQLGPDNFTDSVTLHTVSGGLQEGDFTVGTGKAAGTGMNVTVQYTGWLSNGSKFDSSRDRSQSFPFVLGQGKVIAGWDQGVVGMKVGGKRRLLIPPALGYGASGSGSTIPPNSTLIFDVELLSAC